jgi:hypothetical protein
MLLKLKPRQKNKIEPFMNTLIEKFQAAFYPYMNVLIDDMVIG